jgi:hypothetical protein
LSSCKKTHGHNIYFVAQSSFRSEEHKTILAELSIPFIVANASNKTFEAILMKEEFDAVVSWSFVSHR